MNKVFKPLDSAATQGARKEASQARASMFRSAGKVFIQPSGERHVVVGNDKGGKISISRQEVVKPTK
jgi:hypothetical protein